MSGEICGDNRFEVIEAAKSDIIKRTNIESCKEDMAALDSMLFRSWQMGWLDKYDPTKPKSGDAVKMRTALEAVKDAIETDVLYAPGCSPSYESVERVRKVYQKVLVALGKGGTSNDNTNKEEKPTNDMTVIPEGELLSFGFCKYGVEDKDNRWVAEEPLLVIPLKSIGLNNGVDVQTSVENTEEVIDGK